jgi:hypothetical protein
MMDFMSMHSEYLFVCRSCNEAKRAPVQDLSDSLTALLCEACGNQHEPDVRAMLEAPFAAKVLPVGAMQRMLVRWHVQV